MELRRSIAVDVKMSALVGFEYYFHLLSIIQYKSIPMSHGISFSTVAPSHILFKVPNNVKHSSPPEKRLCETVHQFLNHSTTLSKQNFPSFEYVFFFCDKDLQQKRTNKKRCRKQCDLYQIDSFNT